MTASDQFLSGPGAGAQTPVEFGRGMAIFVIVVGVLSVIFGFVALAYPDVTLLVISLIFGINLIVFSAVDLVEAITDGDQDAVFRVLGAMLGLLGLVAGLIVLRHPWNSLAVLILVLGIYLVVAGFVGAIRAFRVLSSDRAARMLGAIATLAFGVIILALPELSLATLALLAGLGMVARGAVAVVLGIWALKLAKA